MRKQVSFALALSMVMTSGIATVANAAADDGKNERGILEQLDRRRW